MASPLMPSRLFPFFLLAPAAPRPLQEPPEAGAHRAEGRGEVRQVRSPPLSHKDGGATKQLLPLPVRAVLLSPRPGWRRRGRSVIPYEPGARGAREEEANIEWRATRAAMAERKLTKPLL